jgi:hypothetical protein
LKRKFSFSYFRDIYFAFREKVYEIWKVTKNENFRENENFHETKFCEFSQKFAHFRFCEKGENRVSFQHYAQEGKLTGANNYYISVRVQMDFKWIF